MQFSSPVLKDGLLFAVTANGNLFCVDASAVYRFGPTKPSSAGATARW